MLISPKHLLAFAALLLACGSFAQDNFWQPAPDRAKFQNVEIQALESDFYALDLVSFRKILEAAPTKSPGERMEESYVLLLPTPQGILDTFEIYKAPIMHPELQRKYPGISTYRARQKGGKRITGTLDITYKGFHAMFFDENGQWFIDPINREDTLHYQVYSKKNFRTDKKMNCLVETLGEGTHEVHFEESLDRVFGDCQLRTYRTVVACTGEYAIFHGGTKPLAMSAIVTSVNRVNTIVNMDMAIQLELIPNNDDVVYLNPNTDPYTNNNGVQMLSQNQTTLDNVIGSANYDFGHVFSTGGGGVAYLNSVCNNSLKAGGVTGLPQPIGDPFDIDYVCHEMGHQMGANHTQNNPCNRSNGSAFEPGSASTIMGYAGICNPNVQNNSDAYYHARSLVEMTNRMIFGGGNNCANVVPISNNPPIILSVPDGLTLPISTPFELTGEATDPDGDDLLYCWEQYNNEVNNPMPPLPTNTQGPVFRSLNPDPSPTRVFPNIDAVVNNTMPTWEVLPSVTRGMTFRLTIRDQFEELGCLDQSISTFSFTQSAGPFLVTFPNAAGLQLPSGGLSTVTWDVANTAGGAVNAPTVDIFLSVDGGYTYPETLAVNVPNNGSAEILFPEILTTTARIKVKGHNHVFFDISNNNFELIESCAFFDLNVAANNATCGLNNGTAIALPSGGAEYFYAWSNGAITQEITNLAPGTYGVTVTTNLGCVLEESVIVAPSEPLTLQTSSEDSSCGEDNGTASAQGFGGGGNYQFLWSTGANTASITNLAPGTYTVTVTSQDLCVEEASVTIAPSQGVSAQLIIQNTTCGLDNGTASATGNGADAYTYLWSNGQTTSSIANLAPGTYSLTLTGDNGCTDVQSFSIEDSQGIGASLEVQSTTCALDNGSILAQGEGGESYVYLWSTGETTPQIDNLAPGTYTLTLTSELGCSVVVTETIFNSLPISVVIFPEPTTCGLDNGSASATAEGGNQFSYLWNTGENTPTIFNLASGNYTVTVTSEEGCVASSSIIIFPSDPLVVNLIAENTQCGQDNGSALAEVESGGLLFYAWSTGESTPGISGLSAGIYFVTVTDEAGCVSINGVEIEDSETLTASVTTSNTSCGLDNGTATALGQGGNGYSYLWNTGSTQASLQNLAPGTYTVTLTSAQGCVAIASGVVEAQDEFLLAFTGNSTSCGLDNGTVTATVNGGTNYTYVWSNGATTPTLTDLAPGIYSVTVSEGAACSAEGSYEIFSSEALGLVAEITPTTCGQNNGALSVVASGGNGSYQYAWSNGSTDSALTDLSEGTYILSLTDTGGCFLEETYAIDGSEGIEITLEITPLDCDNTGGALTALASGGLTFGYLWSNGSTQQQIDNLSEGLYAVTVSNEVGCTEEAQVQLTAPAVPLVQLLAQGTSCGLNNGTLVAEIDNVLNPIYLWSNGSTEPTLENLSPGIYSLTLTGQSGCSAVALASIEVSDPLVLTLSSTSETCPFCADGTASVQAQGAESYTFLWSNGSSEANLDNLAPGSYSVTATGDNGCVAIGTVTVGAFGCDDFTATALIQNPPCFDGLGSIALTVEGGSSPYSFVWSEGSETATLTALAGTYTVTITDQAQCILVETFTLVQPEFLQILISVESETCREDCDGAVAATVSGGMAPYAFVWSTGDTLAQLMNLCADRYFLTVTDAQGCQSTIARDVLPGNLVQPEILGDTLLCFGETGLLYATGNYPFYVWSEGSQADSLLWQLGGTYAVTATDNKGCSGTASLSVTLNPELLVNIERQGNTLTASANGGTPPYAYLWSTGDQEAAIIASENALYEVVVTDGKGCTAAALLDFNVSSLQRWAQNIRIYPNPVTHWLMVENDNQEPLQSIQVLDNAGKTIEYYEASLENRYDLSKLTPGNYVLILTINNQRIPVKFVKQ
jgi:hypothetical protein